MRSCSHRARRATPDGRIVGAPRGGVAKALGGLPHGRDACQAKPTSSAASRPAPEAGVARVRAPARAAPAANSDPAVSVPPAVRRHGGKRREPRYAAITMRTSRSDRSPGSRAGRARRTAPTATMPRTRTGTRRPRGTEPEHRQGHERAGRDGEPHAARPDQTTSARNTAATGSERSAHREDHGEALVAELERRQRSERECRAQCEHRPSVASSASAPSAATRPAQRAWHSRSGADQAVEEVCARTAHQPPPTRAPAVRRAAGTARRAPAVMPAVPGAVPDREAVLLEVLGAEGVRGEVAQRGFQTRTVGHNAARSAGAQRDGDGLHRPESAGDPSSGLADGRLCSFCVCVVHRRGDHRPVLRASVGGLAEAHRSSLIAAARWPTRPTAARCGVEVSLAGGVGDDEWGDWLEERLRAEGWGCAGWRACPASPRGWRSSS